MRELIKNMLSNAVLATNNELAIASIQEAFLSLDNETLWFDDREGFLSILGLFTPLERVPYIDAVKALMTEELEEANAHPIYHDILEWACAEGYVEQDYLRNLDLEEPVATLAKLLSAENMPSTLVDKVAAVDDDAAVIIANIRFLTEQAKRELPQTLVEALCNNETDLISEIRKNPEGKMVLKYPDLSELADSFGLDNLKNYAPYFEADAFFDFNHSIYDSSNVTDFLLPLVSNTTDFKIFTPFFEAVCADDALLEVLEDNHNGCFSYEGKGMFTLLTEDASAVTSMLETVVGADTKLNNVAVRAICSAEESGALDDLSEYIDQFLKATLGKEGGDLVYSPDDGAYTLTVTHDDIIRAVLNCDYPEELLRDVDYTESGIEFAIKEFDLLGEPKDLTVPNYGYSGYSEESGRDEFLYRMEEAKGLGKLLYAALSPLDTRYLAIAA